MIYVLLRQFASGGNQHNIYYSDRAEAVTSRKEVAEAWCEDLGWGGKRYFTEVESINNIMSLEDLKGVV